MDAIVTSEAPEIKLHFLDYWRVIRLRRSLILTVFLLCLITSTLLTFWLPKQYSSTVQIQVEKDLPDVPLEESRQVVQSFDPYFLTTQFSIIKSQSILTNVIVKLGLNTLLASQNGDNTPWSVDETFDYLQRRVGVDQTRGTSLIEITVRNPQAEVARDIANAIAQSYKESRLDQWKLSRTNGIAVMQEQVARQWAELRTEETNLDNLRTELKIPETDDNNPVYTATIHSETVRALEMRRIDAQLEFNQYSNILSKLQAIDKEDHEKLKSALTTAYAHQLDPDLTALSERLISARALVLAMQQHYGVKNPELQAAEVGLTNAQADFDRKFEGVMLGLQAHVDETRDLYDQIEKREAQIEATNNVLFAQYRPYLTMKRQLETKRRSIEEIDRKILDETLEANQPLQNNVIVRNWARIEKRPVSPKSAIIIPLGVLIGMMVGVGLAFFIEYLDTSVKTIDDVERSLQAPVLGVIPQNVGNVMEDGPESPHAEAYRVLRTNLLFSRKNDGWNTLSVLSGGAGEGKTTTLFNLATVFAQNGQRILVVDSDLRRPSIHKMLHTNNSHGLTDLLLKQKTVDQVIQKTKLATLDFLPSGKLPSSSMSILGSTPMKDLIQELKRRYDFIFFDSPPLLGVSDASILASEMDMVLQVIQYRRYPQPMTLRAKQMILKVGGQLMGLVLNNINMSQDENYYYYSGYYDYEYRSQQKDTTVVQLSDAAKASTVDIKQKY
jgi:capsular exopolysaccharide synthesis family protein